MKYLLLLLIVLAVLWLMRLGGARRDSQKTSQPGSSKRRDAQAQMMVACAHCGVHLPRAEAVAGAGGSYYCSEAHRQLHQAARKDAA